MKGTIGILWLTVLACLGAAPIAVAAEGGVYENHLYGIRWEANEVWSIARRGSGKDLVDLRGARGCKAILQKPRPIDGKSLDELVSEVAVVAKDNPRITPISRGSFSWKGIPAQLIVVRIQTSKRPIRLTQIMALREGWLYRIAILQAPAKDEKDEGPLPDGLFDGFQWTASPFLGLRAVR